VSAPADRKRRPEKLRLFSGEHQNPYQSLPGAANEITDIASAVVTNATINGGAHCGLGASRPDCFHRRAQRSERTFFVSVSCVLWTVHLGGSDNVWTDDSDRFGQHWAERKSAKLIS
jgi:hypothetical protein